MPKGKKKLVTPEFERIPVSTKTVIGLSSSTYDITRMFELLPIAPYTLVPKKRGRRSHKNIEDPNKDLPSGSIITLKFFEKVRGVDLKPSKKGANRYFRNALSVVIKVEDKLVNFKLSANGKFQMTGIKRHAHAVRCIQHLWEHILQLDDHTLYTSHNPKDKSVSVIIKTVMTNIDFSLGFLVNRENLDKYVNEVTDFNSLLETSFGYTGCNIKMPIEGGGEAIYGELETITLDFTSGEWTTNITSYNDYIKMLSTSDRNKETRKVRYNTFLVFHSGNVILSGATMKSMKIAYERFLGIIQDIKPQIEEKLITVGE